MNRITFLLLLTLLPAALWADENPSTGTEPFAWVRASESASTVEGLGVIELDRDVFSETREGLPDVRLFRIQDDEKLEWAYRVRERNGAARAKDPRAIGTEVRSFEKTDEGDLVYIVKIGKEAPMPGSIRIDTPLRNFEKTVTVEGSRDETEWEPLADGVLVYDREAFFDFRRTEVKLPETEARFFRIRIEDATDQQQSALREVTRSVGGEREQRTETTSVTTRAFRVDQIRLFTPKSEPDRDEGRATHAVEIVSREENEETGETEIVLDTGTAPLRRLALAVTDRNFHRAVRIDLPRTDDPDRWREIGKASIHRYDVAGLSEEDLEIGFPETEADRIRLRIENGDSRPLGVESVSGIGTAYELVFLSEPGDRWELFYGAEEDTVSLPEYDTGVLVRAEEKAVPEEPLLLGAAVTNPDFDEDAARIGTPWFAQKWVLHAFIAIVVAVLIWVLYGVARQVDQTEADA